MFLIRNSTRACVVNKHLLDHERAIALIGDLSNQPPTAAPADSPPRSSAARTRACDAQTRSSRASGASRETGCRGRCTRAHTQKRLPDRHCYTAPGPTTRAWWPCTTTSASCPVRRRARARASETCDRVGSCSRAQCREEGWDRRWSCFSQETVLLNSQNACIGGARGAHSQELCRLMRYRFCATDDTSSLCWFFRSSSRTKDACTDQRNGLSAVVPSPRSRSCLFLGFTPWFLSHRQASSRSLLYSCFRAWNLSRSRARGNRSWSKS